ncbi:MAG: acylphosphatase [Rhizobiales bacterium]|nr:acylphosphatase [Hyphomicrobiales bacterium]
MADHSVRIVVTGRVQGVGYRAWVTGRAEVHGVSGWVRNRRDGTVEAVFVGDEQVVAAIVAECRQGPRMARVEDVAVSAWDGPALEGFAELPTE